MSRYVDIEGDWVDDALKVYSLGYYDDDEYAIPFEALGSAPSIDIVRCGECKYCGKDRIKWSVKDDDGNWIDTKFNACYALADSKIGIKEVSLDDYCSWGEREGE